jgi:hypothetical protein
LRLRRQCAETGGENRGGGEQAEFQRHGVASRSGASFLAYRHASLRGAQATRNRASRPGRQRSADAGNSA